MKQIQARDSSMIRHLNADESHRDCSEAAVNSAHSTPSMVESTNRKSLSSRGLFDFQTHDLEIRNGLIAEERIHSGLKQKSNKNEAKDS
jgi:hypothetical protein